MLQPEDSRGWEKLRARAYANKRYARNPASVLATNQRWANENPERSNAIKRNWAKENPEKAAASKLAYRQKDPEQLRARQRQNRHDLVARDPDAKIRESLRGRIGRALARGTKGASTKRLLGMELPEYRIYLQGQFQAGMTWKNHGPIWHIDHIRPCANFDLTCVEQQKQCFNWSNTQPLLSEDNWRKGAHF